MGEETTVSKNFIEQEIDKDLAEGVYSEVWRWSIGKPVGTEGNSLSPK